MKQQYEGTLLRVIKLELSKAKAKTAVAREKVSEIYLSPSHWAKTMLNGLVAWPPASIPEY
jgi:hypothetical protein